MPGSVKVTVVVPATRVPSGARAGVNRNARITWSNFSRVLAVADRRIDFVALDLSIHPHPESHRERRAAELLGWIVERKGEISKLGRMGDAASAAPADTGTHPRTLPRTYSLPCTAAVPATRPRTDAGARRRSPAPRRARREPAAGCRRPRESGAGPRQPAEVSEPAGAVAGSTRGRTTGGVTVVCRGRTTVGAEGRVI